MAKKATFKTVPGPDPEPKVDVVDPPAADAARVDDVDTVDASGNEIAAAVNALLALDLEAEAAEDYEALLQIAKELQSSLRALDLEQREMEALAVAPTEQVLTPVAGVVDVSLGAGPILQVPVYLKKPWARQVDVAVGGCIGYAVLRAGVDLNLFVDSVRGGLASDTPPA